MTKPYTTPIVTRFVAFYSYKGGVGRTLALANCARVLAASGKKVVLMDLDLEAPGLLHFDTFLPKSHIKHPTGFAEYLATCLQDGPPQTLDSFIHACKGKPDDKGETWLMPAGCDKGPDYLAFLNDKTWSKFYREEGYKILENLRGHIIAEYQPDYVLIDSRTGLSEIGGIATHQLADIVVLVFNLNEQNLTGAKRVFDSILKNAPLKPRIILTASPVPVMPIVEGSPFAKKMRRISKDFEGAFNADKPLVIPYHPLLAYDDRLLVDDGDLFSSDRPYRRLAETIQEAAEVDASIYLKQMVEPLQKNDWQQVLEIAEYGLTKIPNNFALLRNLSHAYYLTGNLEKALLAIEQALSVDNNIAAIERARLLLNKSVILDRLQKPEATIAVYDEILQRFGDSKNLALQEQVAKGLFYKGITLGQLEKPEAEIAAYDVLLQRFGDSQELALQEHVAKALVNKGVRLRELEKPEAEIAAYDELLRRFGNSQDLALQESVARALINKGMTFGKMESPESEIDAYDALIQRFGDSQELVLQERFAKALVNKGVSLGKLGNSEAAIAAYDKLLQCFGNSKEIALQEQVANALVNKGVKLGQLGNSEAEIAAYDELLQLFGESQALSLQEPIAQALFNKGVTLGQLEKPEAEIAAYDELFQRFGDSQELALQEHVAKAFIMKGVRFEQLGNPEAEIAVYDEFLNVFSQSKEPKMLNYVSSVLNARGFCFLITSKRCFENTTHRKERLQAALADFEIATQIGIAEHKTMILGNQGYTLYLLNRKHEAQAILQEALTLGGQQTYDDEIADSRMHEIPEDSEFRLLLEQLWAQVTPMDSSNTASQSSPTTTPSA